MSLDLILCPVYSGAQYLLNARMSVPEVREMVATSPHAFSHGDLLRLCTSRAHCVCTWYHNTFQAESPGFP